jgi:hypothetical protein
MPHDEASWRMEMSAHEPQTCDRVDLDAYGPELAEWRLQITQEPALRQSLDYWSAYLLTNKLAVPVEQVADDGALIDPSEWNVSLSGCPEECRRQVIHFLEHSPEVIRDYLTYTCYGLVCTERKRRTGNSEWAIEAASGSAEVLHELMFKWGPRFRRHRWAW